MSEFDPSKLFLFGRDTVIPSPFQTLVEPEHRAVARAGALGDEDEVLALCVNGADRAYAVRVAAPHHIIEDTVGATPVVVTF